MSLILLGDPLGGAVRAVGRSEGVVDEQVGIGGQLLPKTKKPKSCQNGGKREGGRKEREGEWEGVFGGCLLDSRM